MLSKIVEEVDDKSRRRQQQKPAENSSSRESVDRTGRPTCTTCTGVRRSTGTVDRSEGANSQEVSVDRNGRPT